MASITLLHVDIRERPSHVIEQIFLSHRYSGVHWKVNVDPCGIVVEIVVNNWFGRNALSVVDSGLFSHVVYYGSRGVRYSVNRSFGATACSAMWSITGAEA
jgi:hypothetical protein